MDSRMNKYKEEDAPLTRVSRNEELYKEINNTELNDFTIKSNATVLGNHENEIDIEKIKKILDTRYKESAPKRKSISVSIDQEESSIVPEATTKEYDINSFLAQAKNEKEETYEEVRAKKLRDTQFDILSNLNLPKKDEELEEEKEEVEDKDLMNLINTITINEVKQEEKKSEETLVNPLDILSDLKGSDNTEVLEGIHEEIIKEENQEKTNEIKQEDTNKENTKIDNTFYTTTNLFKKKDFVDDEFIDTEKIGIGIKILIAVLIIAFLVGLFIFLKSFLNF